MSDIKENLSSAKAQMKETFRITTTRPVAILMVVIGIAVFGWFSLNKLPLTLMPDISYPSLTVRTEFPGASPEDIEDQVSRRIEQSLAVVDSLVNISSISKAGLSDVILEFRWNTDMNQATSDVREKLDEVFLPEEAERPLILRYDPTLDPIIRIALSADEVEEGVTSDDLATLLRDYTENDVREKLESLEGVAAARIRGGLERELLVSIDKNALKAKQIDIATIESRVRSENINVAGGYLQEGETEFQVRVLNEYQDLDTIRNLIIDRRDGIEIRLGEVAKVYWHHKDREIYTRVDGKPSVELNIFKEADANIVAVAERVRRKLYGTPQELALVERIRTAEAEEGEESESDETSEEVARDRGEGDRGRPEQMPQYLALQAAERGWSYSILTDQSVFIQNSIDEVSGNALVGGLLAIAVLFLFLHSVKSTVLIGLTIPVSIIATFAPMNMFGVSLNIMSLGGLALGIGMLVDNSIVVLESIFRCKEEGDSLIDSVIRGTGEVGGAVVASTLTTIAVFFPIVFVEGVAGQIFGDMALTVVFSLLASLLAALFFIPMLASRELPKGSMEISADVRQPLNSWNWLKDRFQKFWRKGRNLLSRIVMIIAFVPFHIYIAVIFLIHFVGELVIRLVKLLMFTVFFLLRWTIKIFAIVTGVVIKPILWTFGKFIESINNAYPYAIRWALANKIAVLAIVAALAAGTYYLAADLKAELIPEMHQGEFNVRIKAPVGTDIEKTNLLTEKVENSILAVMTTENGESELVRQFQTMATVVGTEMSTNTRSDEGENTSVITVRLLEDANFKIEEELAINKIRQQIANIPGINTATFDRPALFSFKTPIEVEIKGRNRLLLKQYSNEATAAMQQIEGITDVKNSIQPGYPELLIKLDRSKLARFDLDIRVVAEKIRSMIQGTTPTEYREGDRQYDIRIRLEKADVKNRVDLESLVVSGPGSSPIALKDVADVIAQEGPNEIRRIDQERTAVISANTSGIDLLSATIAIEKALSELSFNWQNDYAYEITGQTEEMKTSTDSMTWAIALAIFLVYIVMASQFESLLQPLIIIFTIPLAMIGVVAMLYITNTPVSVIVFIGAIMLAGIVVNNAIVLVDYINQLRARGLAKTEAIVEAGKARLRPILMTTLTTVLGLLPLALGLGAGAEIRAPMAWTVIAGLISSTMLTLLVIPTVYALIDRKKGL